MQIKSYKYVKWVSDKYFVTFGMISTWSALALRMETRMFPGALLIINYFWILTLSRSQSYQRPLNLQLGMYNAGVVVG
jgi:hypothetical protein